MHALTMPPSDLDRLLSAVEGVRVSVTAEIRSLRADAFGAIERLEQRTDARLGQLDGRLTSVEKSDIANDAVNAYERERRHMTTIGRRWIVGIFVSASVGAASGLIELVRIILTGRL